MAVAEKTRMSRQEWLTKVPAITATFWVIKVLSTTIGETFADYLSVNVGLGPAITDIAMLTVLAAALTLQLRTHRYTPWIYWLCVVLVSIVGTQITDFFTDTLGVSLYLSTGVFSILLAAVFTIWYRQEGTLAITSIDTPRREGFYWAAILVTFALGTAAGGLGLGASLTGWIFLTVIVVLVTREQLLVNRHGVAVKGEGPHGGRRRDLAWAGAGAAAILVAGLVLGSLQAAALQNTAAAAGPANTVQVHPTTALGDVSNFTTIATDVQAKVSANDLPAATAKVKDLEVAWDGAEAGLKPRDPADWHTLDGQIDDVLTSLRAGSPNQANCAANLTTLIDTLNIYDGV